MPMYSDQPVVSLPYCGYSERFLKSLIKKKPIDDMLPMDIPDPWYNSHMVISAEQTPSWLLKSLPTSSPMYCNNKRNTQFRHQKSSLNRNASTRTTNTTCSTRSSTNNKTRNLPALPSTSPSLKSLSRSPAALPSTSNYPTISSAKSMRRPDTESIIRWIDQRLSLQGPAGKRTRIPIRRSSLFQQPNPQLTTQRQQQQPTIQSKPATAPPLLVRRRSSSTSSDVNRILGSLASSKGPDMRLHQLTGPDKYDMSGWPHVLSQNILEQDRLVAQHYIWRTAFDGDFSAPIRQYLETKSAIVLDMGCGPGTWTMEMATEFPRSTFIGIDLAKHYPRDIKPRNCHFHAIDFMPGFQPKLPLPDNSVDFIFQRDLNWDMAAHMWKPLVKEYLRVLKPGGWIELREPDMETQSSRQLENDMNNKLIYGMSLRHQDPFVARRLPTVLAANGFRRVESHFQSLPLGWDDSPFEKAVSSHYMFTLKSLAPWLAPVMNTTHERYNSYIADLPAEWRKAKTYLNWHCIVAQKPPRPHASSSTPTLS